jgi:predicted heme/steroid binding protein
MFHYLRLMTGYLHVLVGIFWFGTILYVHLILKPAYAAHGLPRGEVRLGIVSIGIMAVTGTILTFGRVPSLSFFIDTRFGILLMIKIILFLIMAGTAVYVVAFLGPRLKAGQARPGEDQAAAMTKSRLLSFDGIEGRPAYFAFAGKVYDVSRSEHWGGGKHFGRHSAGEDLTDAIEQAPHGEDKVLAMTQVGEITETHEKTTTPKHTRVFFFLAYMNLILVLSVILILALWRWL